MFTAAKSYFSYVLPVSQLKEILVTQYFFTSCTIISNKNMEKLAMNYLSQGFQFRPCYG